MLGFHVFKWYYCRCSTGFIARKVKIDIKDLFGEDVL
jgi:hypothetical protein